MDCPKEKLDGQAGVSQGIGTGASTVFGRSGAPGDLALAAVLPACDEATWITGEVLRVAGGAE